MPIPDYQTLMLPLLRIAGDEREHVLGDIIEFLADEFKVSQEERRTLLPSGGQEILDNRVAWARTYLKKAGLLESPGRGRIHITARGLQVLQGKPGRIDVRFLSRFPEFVEFKSGSARRTEPEQDVQGEPETPEEKLESSYQNLRRALAQELLERVRDCSPRFFERLVVDLLVAMGYGGTRKDAGQAVGQSGDDGIDGIIKEDKLGFDVVYVQAKRWNTAVGRPIVQAFAGSLEGQRARKGVLMTTSRFTQDAEDYVGRIEKRIVLIDGEQLAQLMIDHGIGVTEIAMYSVKKVDSDYFLDE